MITLDFAKPVYNTPMGLPFYWRDDQTGVLPAAMMAYVYHAAEPDKVAEPTREQMTLVISFFIYFIHAPCWERPDAGYGERRKLAKLRMGALEMDSAKDVRKWIGRCLQIGIDPL